MTRRLAATAFGLLALLGLPGPAAAAAAERPALRVCADPNNLPFSNRAGEGFENRLAELVAAELGAEVTYTWHAQRRGFVRETLKAEKCDVIMGVPYRYELVATTQPYYRSSYVYVYREDRGLDLRSMRDPRLRDLTIGVHLIGDDGANTPPAHALGAQGIVDNVVGQMIYGDYREPSPPARLIEAVADGRIDVAAVWGPTGGYFARRSAVPLTAVPITDTAAFAPRKFEYAIAMGVRKGDEELRSALDAVLLHQETRIKALLDEYGIPLVDRASNGR